MADSEKFPNLVNPTALDAIVEAGGRRGLVAAVDIVDDRGNKLWARDREISAELRERLKARRLKQPLETSVRFAAGLKIAALTDELKAFLGSGHVVARMVGPWASSLEKAVPRLRLQPVAELLVTTMVEVRPPMYAHATRGMALAGAMAMRANAPDEVVQLAMLGGLLHDLGELYLDRSYIEEQGRLDVAGYRRIATHPRVSQLLLSDLGGYPKALSTAVGEHHERLDGSGYPRRTREVSALGKLLIVMEATLGLLPEADATCERAAFGLRMMPGEHDSQWVGFVTDAARRLRDGAPAPGPAPTVDADALQDCLRSLNAVLVEGARTAADVAAATRHDPDQPVQRVAQRAADRLGRIRTSWNALGLWSEDGGASADDAFEIDMALREIRYRLETLRRDCVWPESATLGDADLSSLDPLWACVQGWEPVLASG